MCKIIANGQSQAGAKTFSRAVSEDPPNKPTGSGFPHMEIDKREGLSRPHMLVCKAQVLNLMYCNTTSRLVRSQQFLKTLGERDGLETLLDSPP